MDFTEQHKVFMVMSYFRNGVKIDGVWQYSLALCMEEFGEEFPDIAVEYTQFRQTLNICLKNFQENRPQMSHDLYWQITTPNCLNSNQSQFN
jgi:hypothetical protein